MRRREEGFNSGRPLIVGPIATLVVIVLALAGCGDDGTANDAGSSDQEHTAAQAGIDDSINIRYGKPTSSEPRVHIPSAAPPKQLTTADLRVGRGPAAETGDTVVVNYVGYHYTTKRQYDTSYGTNPVPYKVTLGAGDFIEGFEEGLAGMKTGGRRQITIPPDKAYGDRGYPGQVKPGETVVFVVDLEAIDTQK